jgi:hypothetical protein
VVSSLSDNLSIATTLTSLDLSANKIEKSGAQTNPHDIGAEIKSSTEG